ncbi:MAG: hypothetical protein A4S14_08360 [Proteobacteria bacterium SG_bin9]|nr:MAG: hypothetical protein A4S14_08360 [Proteobacteria bacterium SG_bin9]
MLKTISAAVLAASLLAAPAFAAGTAKKTDAMPATKSATVDAKAQIKPVKKLTVKKASKAKHLRHKKQHASKAAIAAKVKMAKPVLKPTSVKQKRA